MKTEPKPLGILLRKLRNEKKLTLRELGAKTNLTFGYLAQIERGLANAPSVESLCRIADALETNDSLSDNQFIGIAEKHELLFDDLSLRP